LEDSRDKENVALASLTPSTEEVEPSINVIEEKKHKESRKDTTFLFSAMLLEGLLNLYSK